MEEELQQQFDELLESSPEMTFFEASTELVKKGELNFAATEDPDVHTWLYQLFRRAKTRAQTGRMNRDI